MGFGLAVQTLVCFSCVWGFSARLQREHGGSVNDKQEKGILCGHLDHSLVCLNDYHSTIRCEMNLTSEQRHHDAPYWLEFQEHSENNMLKCVLTSHTYPWVCVLKSPSIEFTDQETFRISLHPNYSCNNGSKVLLEEYKLFKNIQPVPPPNLTLQWTPEEAVFRWLTGYDEINMLRPDLAYQLRIQRKDKVVDVDCGTSTNVSVPTTSFAPDANYEAHVRSRPGKGYYQGVWSHWGPALHWTTGPSDKTPHIEFMTLLLALLALPMIWFCHFSYTRLKKCTFHPAPAPHIGDFKCSAMLPEKVGELLHREESLQIHSLSEEPTSTQHEWMSRVEISSGHASSNSSPSTLQTSGGSKVSLASWMQILISAEKGSAAYSDEYCTLSDALERIPQTIANNPNPDHCQK